MSTPFDVLAARVDALSRQVRANAEALAEVRRIAERADQVLDDLVDRVAAAEELAASAASVAADGRDTVGVSGDERPIVSWLAEPHSDSLTDLVTWIDRVLIHYPATADALSECWPYHPWVVEELVALHAAWAEAYEGERAGGGKAVDWHDRHRPGTLARIRAKIEDCSLDAHEPGRRADHRLHPSWSGGGQISEAIEWWTKELLQTEAP